MANASPEQDLINSCVEVLKQEGDDEIKIGNLINKSCKSQTFADLEYDSVSGCRWAIEAKSHETKDNYNSAHKIFGELLKETGRENRSSARIGVLIPESGVEFYSRLYNEIDEHKFVEFGELIPIYSVIIHGDSGLTYMSWKDLYGFYGSIS